ncbi:MAG: type II toxin-antitoxin system TacA family antitoxin [Rhodoplanes sp.]
MADTLVPSQGRVRTINMRVLPGEQALIDRAAEASGKTRSEFMLDAARREAESVLLDRRLFLLDEKAYREFVDRLDAPPQANDKLRRLLATRAPWEA